MRGGVLAAALFALLASGASAQEGRRSETGREAFSFYGLRFGMKAEEVHAVLPLNEKRSEALKPGHGMADLVVGFDHRGRLTEIRASWERPGEPLREEGLRRALLERFVQAVPARWREVSASLDEFSNRSALTVVLVALDLREENLTHFKNEYLRLMD